METGVYIPIIQTTVLKLPSVTNCTGEPANGSFHTVANLQSETSEIIDTRMTAPVDRFFTVALATYNKQVAEIEADIEKLVYTMKTFSTTAGHMRKDWLLPSAHVVIG